MKTDAVKYRFFLYIYLIIGGEFLAYSTKIVYFLTKRILYLFKNSRAEKLKLKKEQSNIIPIIKHSFPRVGYNEILC